jgi:hypothetical protein
MLPYTRLLPLKNKTTTKNLLFGDVVRSSVEDVVWVVV